MKKLLAIFVLLCGSLSLYADHIKGGELYYEYLGQGRSSAYSRYKISFKLYLDCNALPDRIDSEIPLTIFSRTNNQQYGRPVTAPFQSEQYIRFDPASNPCISNAPKDVCYRIRIFTATVELLNDPKGYTISYQRCCRIIGIVNLRSPSNVVGATYSTDIPGTNFTVVPEAYKNSSPRFTTNDAVAVCSLSPFSISYAADEPDKIDSIAYQFCSGYDGASPFPGNAAPDSSAPPPYEDLYYQPPFDGSAPFGPQAIINRKTGLVTGTAPAYINDPRSKNQYVITVCAYEYRQGVLINIHRKDIHVKVSDCIPLNAQLKPELSFCDDLNVTFRNEQTNPSGSIYIWEYGDKTKRDTSFDALGTIQHQYKDTGAYKVQVTVIYAGQCIDSAKSVAKVYPGFFPGFTIVGACKLIPYQFTDTTKSRYGVVSSWKWNFGDETSQTDTSSKQNPSYKYSTIGTKRVQLTVQSDKGCLATTAVNLDVKDKPLIGLPFRDTLICSIDTLQLFAQGNGIFSWLPNTRIINPNTSNPLVYPTTTTYYRVTMNESGCINTDSVRVRVIDVVTVNAGLDSTICLSDPVRLNAAGDGLKFLWSPPSTLDNVVLKSPTATPTGTITYNVIATVGKCSSNDNITMRTIPYPLSNAGADTTVCFEDTATLRGSMKGSRFVWSPVNTLSNGNTLTPFAFPVKTMKYLLTVYDTLGCPKPTMDEVVVTVRDKILAFSGNDTNIVIDQPLQLRGRGADLYLWSPPTGLNNTNIFNPIALLQNNITYIMKAYTIEGCFSLDTINVRVFKTKPDIFVPTAFAPGGFNRVLRPVPVGIAQFDYFRVFNRWGQLVFETRESGKGWDGTIAGKGQDAGTFAWMVRGRDYTGRLISKRGTAVLVR